MSVLIGPYLAIGLVVLLMLVIIGVSRMPVNGDKNKKINLVPTIKRIISIPHYREGVIAQFFYGIALKGLCDDAKFGAAGLIMAILGRSVLPPLQASIIDLETIGNSFPAVNASFILPFICFAVVAWYGGRVVKRTQREF